METGKKLTQNTHRPRRNRKLKLMPHNPRRQIRQTFTLHQPLRDNRPLLESVYILLSRLATAGITNSVASTVRRHGFRRLRLPFVRVESERRLLVAKAVLVDGGFVLDWVRGGVLADFVAGGFVGRHGGDWG
jgi:hypothetical protein